MILGIDASTPGSGGAKRHLIEILERFNSVNNEFSKVRVWGVLSMLEQLPNYDNIEKISHPFLNRGLIFRLIWQFFIRDRQISGKSDILFSPFGTFTSSIVPYVSMSRNMLIFDKKEQNRFGFFYKLKFILLEILQTNSFKRSRGIIFLSNYAESVISKKINLSNKNTRIIHHGIGPDFIGKLKEQRAIADYSFENPFTFLYVSAIWPYKHQWNVVKAVSRLRKSGYPIILRIVGDIDHVPSGEKLTNTITLEDPENDFIFWEKGVSLNNINECYKKSDAFIFASSCENMPNILIEAMSTGMPILCSYYDPMSEFLEDGGIYFNPLNIDDLAYKLKEFVDNSSLRSKLSTISFNLSKKYNWDKCAEETFKFLYNNIKIK